MQKNHAVSERLVVIDGGTAGIGVIASIKNALKICPLFLSFLSNPLKHTFQPAWTLVGCGVFDLEKTRRPMLQVIPSGVTWVKQSVSRVMPEEKCVLTSSGKK